MEKPIVSVSNLYKSYKEGTQENAILENINFDVKKGERISIMGPSGSGKTTLLNVLSGLDEVTKGSIIIKENDITNMSISQRTKFRRGNVGFIFQNYNLVQSLTAVENTMLPLLMNGFSRKKAIKEAEKMLELVDLIHRKNAFPNKLSGGEKQRVAIVRALIHHPSVIFADEPTGNLDRVTSRTITKIMDDLNKEFQQTMIIVTHDLEVTKVCDRSYHLNGHLKEISNGEI